MRSQLNAIQYLRAIAALLVAYAHSVDLQMNYSTTHSFQQDFLSWQNFGAFGVDIFFVISGFIISYSAGRYKGGREGYAFLSHRFKRINPVYYLATLLFIIISLHSWIRDRVLPLTWLKVEKSIVLLPIFDRTRYTGTILYQAWTLSFEWFFYFLFLITILTGTRYKERWLAIMIITLVVAGSFLHGGDYRLHFITNPIMLEFLLGVGIYGCFSRFTLPSTVSVGLLLAGIAICLFGIIKGFGDIDGADATLDGSLSFTRFLYWGIPAGLLVAGSIFLEKKGEAIFSKGRPVFFGNNRLMALLGNSSYSIYLLNTIIYGGFASLYRRTGYLMNPDLGILVQWLLVIIASVLFYKWVEAPLLRRLRKK